MRKSFSHETQHIQTNYNIRQAVRNQLFFFVKKGEYGYILRKDTP